jgi:hypothetical protein
MVGLSSLAPLRVKKALQIFYVNVVHRAVVYRLVAGLSCVAFTSLKFLLKAFRVAVHLHFKQKEIGHVFLDVHGQVVMLFDCLIWPLSGCGPEFGVGARKQDLHEVWVVQLSIQV